MRARACMCACVCVYVCSCVYACVNAHSRGVCVCVRFQTPPRYLTNYKNPCFYVRDANGDIVLHGVHGDMKVRLKCLPYFHLIGVDKSGTTDLWFRLTQHSHVVQNTGVLGKETHWWSWRRFGEKFR